MAPFGYIPPPSTGGGGSGGAGEVEIAVTVVDNKFELDGNSRHSLEVLPGMIYKFDVSHTSNGGHVFSLSLTNDNSGSSEYTEGRTRDGTPGGGGSENVQWDVPLDVADTVYYYCSNHPGMGGELNKTGTSSGGGTDYGGIAAMEFDSTALEDTVAALAFKIASANSLAKFDLPSQIVDDFKTESDSDIDTSHADSSNASYVLNRWEGASSIPGITSHATLDTNLVSYYDLDGDGVDSKGSNDLTFHTGSAPKITYDSSNKKIGTHSGIWGPGVTGTSSTDPEYLWRANTFKFTSDFSWSVWIRADSTIDGSDRILDCNYYDGGAPARGWHVYWQSDSRVAFYIYGTGGQGSYSNGVGWARTLTANPLTSDGATWHHLAGTYDPGNSEIKIYLDGSVQETNATQGTPEYTNVVNFAIGERGARQNWYGWDKWQGLIDEVAIWDRVLTATEVSDLYANSSGLGYSGSLVTADLSLVSNVQTVTVAPTTADIVVLYKNIDGTATLNTDIKAWVSRDNGTNWTQGTLVASDSTIDGEVVASAHDISIAGQPSGTQVRYKITTHNQIQNTKRTSIGGVSLGWKDPATSTVTAGGSGGITDLTVATDGLEDDIAALAFKIAADNNLDKFNLSNQIVDDFKSQADSDIDESLSVNEVYDAAGAPAGAADKWSGFVAGATGDTLWNDVTTLITGDETQTGLTFPSVGSVAQTWTRTSGVTQTTGGGGKFGEAYYWDGAAASRITTPDNSGWALGAPSGNTNDFTIELWMYTATQTPNNGNEGFISKGYGNGWMPQQVLSNPIQYAWYANLWGGIPSLGNFSLSNGWNHIAFVREGTTERVYVNGAMKLSGTRSVDFTAGTELPVIGNTITNTGASPHGMSQGTKIEQVRITKGVCRYKGTSTTDWDNYLDDGTTAWTEPTEAFGTGLPATGAYNDIELVSNAQTASAVPSTADVTILYDDTIGTATLNTNIKAWASRDNGTTWTEGTLVAGDTIGGEKLASAHDIDVSGQPSGSQIRYKITTHNQSAALLTSVGGVSLGWTNPSDVSYATVTAERGVSVVPNKSALQQITPSGATGQFYFVTDNKGMYYSNGDVWTLLGSDAPGWGSFTENYGTLDQDNGSGGTVTHTPTSAQPTSILSVSDESQAIHEFASTGVTVSNCFHSPPHTGSHSLVDAGVTIGATSGEITITPPQAWENDSVVMPVTATDGINVINKNIQWSIKANAGPLWDKTAYIHNFQNTVLDTRSMTLLNGSTANSYSTTIKPNSNYTHSIDVQGAQRAGAFYGGNMQLIGTMTPSGNIPWCWETYLYSVDAAGWNWGGTNNWARIFDHATSATHFAIRYQDAGGGGFIGAIGYPANANFSKSIECGLTPGTDFSFGAWHHICWQFDGTTTKSFVDGVQKGSRTGNNWFYNTTSTPVQWPSGNGSNAAYQFFCSAGSTSGSHGVDNAYFTNMRLTIGDIRYSMSGFTNAPIITAPEPFTMSYTGQVP